MDGYELVVKAKQARLDCSIRLIAVLGEGQADVVRCRAADFHGHLVKPVSARQLLHAIASLEVYSEHQRSYQQTSHIAMSSASMQFTTKWH